MKGRFDILIVEDNPGDERLIREALIDTSLEIGKLDVAGRLSDALDVLSRGEHNLLLLDLGLPDSIGLETVRRVLPVKGEAVLVVLSGLSDENVALQAVQLGAQDYLTKGDVNPGILERVIRYASERSLLAARSQLLSRVVEETMTGIILVDQRGQLQYVNRSAGTFPVFRETGSSSCKESQGNHLVSECLIDDLCQMVDRTLSTQTRITRRIKCEAHGEATRHIECTTYPQTHTPGQQDWTILQLIDVTEEVRATDSLIRAHRLEFLGKMAGEVAHEFNNQMAIISGHLEAIKHSDDRTDLNSHLDVCQSSIEYLHKKVVELQAIASRQVTQPERQDLAAVLTSHVNRLRLDHSTTNCIRWTSESSIPIMFDRDQLDFILSTLLGAPFENPLRVPTCIEIRLNREDSAGLSARLTIELSYASEAATSSDSEEETPTIRVSGDGLEDESEFNWDTAAVTGIMHQVGGSFSVISDNAAETRLELLFPTAAQYAFQSTVADGDKAHSVDRM